MINANSSDNREKLQGRFSTDESFSYIISRTWLESRNISRVSHTKSLSSILLTSFRLQSLTSVQYPSNATTCQTLAGTERCPYPSAASRGLGSILLQTHRLLRIHEVYETFSREWTKNQYTELPDPEVSHGNVWVGKLSSQRHSSGEGNGVAVYLTIHSAIVELVGNKA